MLFFCSSDPAAVRIPAHENTLPYFLPVAHALPRREIHAATAIVLGELGLCSRVRMDLVQRQVDSDRYDVDLKQKRSSFVKYTGR
jgi:hypothetical protein